VDFALSGQRIDHRPRDDYYIERCTVFDSALERIGRIVIDREAKPTRALEQRPELSQYLLDGVGAKDPDVRHLHPTVAIQGRYVRYWSDSGDYAAANVRLSQFRTLDARHRHVYKLQLPKTPTGEERPVNATYGMALTLLAGAGLDAAVIQGLDARDRPPIYVVIAIQKITDAEAYKPLPVKGQAAAEAPAVIISSAPATYLVSMELRLRVLL
jgi:hypothetical protein